MYFVCSALACAYCLRFAVCCLLLVVRYLLSVVCCSLCGVVFYLLFVGWYCLLGVVLFWLVLASLFAKLLLRCGSVSACCLIRFCLLFVVC